MELDDSIPLFLKAIEKRKKFAAFPWQLATIVRAGRIFPAWLYDKIAGGAKYVNSCKELTVNVKLQSRISNIKSIDDHTVCNFSFMNFLQAIILGIVQGLTEFIPISSTAHLVFASRWTNIYNGNAEQITATMAVIQLGTLARFLFILLRIF